MKKLIPALCMLLVAAALLGTSTYAWFSMNNQVTASGMQVKAATSKNLVISATSTLKEGESILANSSITGVKELSPASTATLSGSTVSFYAAGSTKVDYSTGAMQDGATTSAATVITAAGTTKGNVVKHTFYIRADGTTEDSFSTLYVNSISVSSSPKNITKALRVGVVSSNVGYIYAPAVSTAPSYKGVIAAGTLGTNDILSSENVAIKTAGDNTANLGEVTSGEYRIVDVYIWYEGQDANCTSANSIEVEELSISLEFTAIN